MQCVVIRIGDDCVLTEQLFHFWIIRPTQPTQQNMCNQCSTVFSAFPHVYPQSPIFRGELAFFKPNVHNIENGLLLKLLHRLQPNLVQ